MKYTRSTRSFVSYIDRSREYYAAQGYRKPYEWAYHYDVPFCKLEKPLSKCRIGLVTTASRAQIKGLGPLKEIYADRSNPPPMCLYTDHLGWDKNATHTNDIETYLPVKRLMEYAASGIIGSISPRFYGVPTDYSQSRTIEQYSPKILEWCREDQVDAVLLSAL